MKKQTLKLSLFWILILSFQQAFAFDSQLSFRIEFSESSDRVSLNGEDSPELRNEVEQIYKWGRTKNSTPLNLKNQKPPFSVDQLMPAVARNRMNIADSIDGPNCWNTTLHLAKALPSIRFTAAHEFHFWTKSPFCKPLKVKSANDLQAGDIMAIRHSRTANGSFQEAHAFTYISPYLSFSKGTADIASPAELIRTSLVLQTFRLYGADHCYYGYEKGCLLWMDHYRCDFSKLPKQVRSLKKRDAKYKRLQTQLNHISDLLTKQTQGQQMLKTRPHPKIPYKVVIEPKTRELFLHSISMIKQDIEKQLINHKHRNSQDSFLWKALWEKSYSLGRQFYCLNRIKNPCDRKMYSPGQVSLPEFETLELSSK